uniref:Uncharacterized protein n=1 Tax=Macrostomum lignano TaxID=282301 RepID=A0A1I8FGT4_9PLAT
MEELGCPAKPPLLLLQRGDAAAEGCTREYGNRMKEIQDEQEEQSVSDPRNRLEDEESGWLASLATARVVHASDSAASCPVACASTDFAACRMCAARFGVPILSCEGARIIAEIRTHVLWCAAGCYKRCLRPDKRFCSIVRSRHSAQRAAVLFAEAAGGKHSLDPITACRQQRPSKKTLQKANPFSVDAEARRIRPSCLPSTTCPAGLPCWGIRAACLTGRGGNPNDGHQAHRIQQRGSSRGSAQRMTKREFSSSRSCLYGQASNE